MAARRCNAACTQAVSSKSPQHVPKHPAGTRLPPSKSGSRLPRVAWVAHSFLPCLLIKLLWMWGITPPPAMVACRARAGAGQRVRALRVSKQRQQLQPAMRTG